MNRKRIVSLIVIAIIAIGALFVIRFLNTGVPVTPLQPKQSSDNASSVPKLSPLIIGNPNARVTMTEYADFKCPECSKYHQGAGSQVRKDYVDTGKVKIVFRPYPVFSEDGAKALVGTYCAQAQGKFTQYHDRLFEYMWVNHFKSGDYQKAIDPVFTKPVMASILTELGMDVAQYDSCLEDKATLKAYEDDLYLAAPDEIQGTPSFIIGGKKVVGVQPYNVFKTLLDIQLR